MPVPRPEYPRPQFVRKDWLNLNGTWEFEIDQGDSGAKRGLLDRRLNSKILVPFCPESELSGIGHTDFISCVWYRRQVKIPAKWKGRRVLLHFQACDYDTTVWVNGTEVGRHRGGFTPFTCDLADVAGGGDTATIVVRARDSSDEPQPKGKQSDRYENYGCLYTRTTGIWQTVWMEPVPEHAMRRPRITPDVGNGRFEVVLPIKHPRSGLVARAILKDDRGEVCRAEVEVLDFSPRLSLPLPDDRRRFWSIDDPFLYDLDLALIEPESGDVVDEAASYAGYRSVTIDGKAIKINGKTVFQRLVLDQGYWPDGIMTAPSDEALRRDIELGIEAGFNGARLHQKVFEERYLYWADKLGYLCWGEFGDWGCGGFGPEERHQQPGPTYIAQWLEALERDYSHPCIVGWCPLNESWQPIQERIQVLDDVTLGMFLATKAMDQTRPVLDTSGWGHRVPESDVFDSHDYEQDPKKFRATHKRLHDGQALIHHHRGRPTSIDWRDQPYFVSEFGGIMWNPKAKPGEAWGYGQAPKTLEEFYTRFEGLCDVLLSHPLMFGYCYTQLTDVFQEQNGIYTFDRGRKFDMKRIRAAQQKPAAIEKLGRKVSRRLAKSAV